jgi:tRNA-dihydrouridine synthase
LPAPTLDERIAVCKKHLHLSVNWKGPVVGINEMRRHYTNYLKGLPGIRDYRYKLVTLPTPEDVNEVLDEISAHYKDYQFNHSKIELVNYHEKCPL